MIFSTAPLFIVGPQKKEIFRRMKIPSQLFSECIRKNSTDGQGSHLNLMLSKRPSPRSCFFLVKQVVQCTRKVFVLELVTGGLNLIVAHQLT